MAMPAVQIDGVPAPAALAGGGDRSIGEAGRDASLMGIGFPQAWPRQEALESTLVQLLCDHAL